MFDKYEKAKIEYLRYNAMQKRQIENKTKVLDQPIISEKQLIKYYFQNKTDSLYTIAILPLLLLTITYKIAPNPNLQEIGNIFSLLILLSVMIIGSLKIFKIKQTHRLFLQLTRLSFKIGIIFSLIAIYFNLNIPKFGMNSIFVDTSASIYMFILIQQFWYKYQQKKVLMLFDKNIERTTSPNGKS